MAVPSPPKFTKAVVPPAVPSSKEPTVGGSQAPFKVDMALELPPCGRTLALLHAAILGNSSISGHVSTSLELLLRLLATVGESAQSRQQTMIKKNSEHVKKLIADSPETWSLRLAQERDCVFTTAVAPLYAASVFCHLPNLLRSLPPEILEIVQKIALRCLKSESDDEGRMPFFELDIDFLRREDGEHLLDPLKLSLPASTIYDRLDQLTKNFLRGPIQLRTEKSYDRSPQNPLKSIGDRSLQGISKFASDGRLSILGADQKKRSNKEACRDRWMEVYRYVLETDVCTTLDPTVFEALQHRVSKVIRSIAFPENVIALAEYVLEMVLKAAALGTPDLDDAELSHLAKGNTNRLWALNRRIREGPERGHSLAIRGHSMNSSKNASQRRHSRTNNDSDTIVEAIGMAKNVLSSQKFNAFEAPLKVIASDLLPEFAEPVRPIVLCLEAGDSHRFNQALIRLMTIKLMSMQHEAMTGYSDLAEMVVISSTLASFIGYLTFYRSFTKGYVRTDGDYYHDALRCSSSLPVDPEQVLAEQWLSPQRSIGILHTLTWIVRYLRFVRFDYYSLEMPSIQRTLALLWKLRQAPELSPSNSSFGRAALCIQASLEELHVAIDAPNMTRSVKLMRGEDMDAVMERLVSKVSQDLKAMDPMVDLRCLEHCLPFLSRTRKILFSKVKMFDQTGEKAGQLFFGRGRRITPSLSGEKNLATVLASKLRNAAILVKTAVEDPVQVRLQRAFLDQYNVYNGVEIGIRRIIDLSSEAIALNAATNVLDLVITKALDRVKGLVLARLKQLDSEDEDHLKSDAAPQLLYLQRYAEEELIAGIDTDLEGVFKSERERIRSAASSSVVGLLPRTLKLSVLETAAAMVAESAEIIAAKQLSRRLDDQLQQQWLGQVKSIVKHVIRRKDSAQQNVHTLDSIG